LARQENDPARVLLLSSRARRRTLFNSALHEFEEAITSFDAAEVFAPTAYHGDIRFDAARHSQLLLRRIAGARKPSRTVVPYPVQRRLTADYDLLFAVFDNPWDSALIHTIEGFRDRCARVACYIPEIWAPNIGSARLRHEPFSDYDHVFVGTFHDVEPFATVTGVASSALAPGVDTDVFSPGSRSYPRVIDVVNLGRRMSTTHEALRRLAADSGCFYLYDDVLNGEAPDFGEHRKWLADVLLRSSYSIANYARCDRPDLNRGVREMGYRFVEGAASGTVMLGAPPDTPQSAEYLGWEDAVVPTPIEAPDIADVIADLERDPARVEAIRRRNISGSLRHHDWVYRWEQVLHTMGITPTEAMARRREHLATEGDRWAS
jgi:hypothetical protein